VNLKLVFRLIGGLAWLLLLPVLARGAPYALTNLWTVDLASESGSAPAVGTDGTIYVGTWKGLLWALNPNGSRKWVFQAGNEIRSASAVGRDGTVYFGCRDRKLYAVRADGTRRWAFLTSGWVDSSFSLKHFVVSMA
jgi:outer membrane protein assembly factor BamB